MGLREGQRSSGKEPVLGGRRNRPQCEPALKRDEIRAEALVIRLVAERVERTAGVVQNGDSVPGVLGSAQTTTGYPLAFSSVFVIVWLSCSAGTVIPSKIEKLGACRAV